VAAGDHRPGKNGKQRIVKISYHAARTLDWYIRAQARRLWW
jgi:site-specific recombinase XerD